MSNIRQSATLEKKDGIARILFNRPEQRNALSRELQEDVISHLEEIRNDDSIAVVITTGGDDASYCAGGDIRSLVQRIENRAGFKTAAKPANLYELVRTFPKVTIAAVNGYCLGGGLSLVLCHDIVIASKEKARFGLPEILLSFAPGQPAGHLFKSIPQKWAFDLLLTGDNWDAETAQQRGIASRVVPHAELQKAAFELAQNIVKLDKVTLEYCKKAAHAAMDQPTRLQAAEISSMLSREHNVVNPNVGKGAYDFLAKKTIRPKL